MKARVVRSRTAESRTADLFAAAVQPAHARSVAPAPALRSAPSPPAFKPVKSYRRQLWYAAIATQIPDAETLQRLCLHALKFTSFVSIEPPDALLLEIRGSVKLFGSLEILQAAIDACWQELSWPMQSATAPSTLGALWLARAHTAARIENDDELPARLAPLSIACTAWGDERLSTLRAMGITRVGELMRLPRAGLSRRFGPGATRDLDIALGRQFAPRRPFTARERFRERCDFEFEIEHVAYLDKALEPLVERCAAFLRKRQAGVQRLLLRLRHREGPATRVQLGLASITSERGRLQDVLSQRLERLELRAAVRSMELISGSLRALSAASLDAFAGVTAAGGRDSAPQLVERLRARLGEEAVYGVCLVPEHRPEAAWGRVHELRLAGRLPDAAALQGADDSMPRPIWLLEQPIEWVPLKILHGPERIESGWWDGKGVARDYYVAQSHGVKLWVFQERQSQRWYLHGVFA
jgi:protein ImuB